MIVLDTNVISELIKTAPAPAVTAFIDSLAPDTLFTTAICEAEIQFGIARLPHGRKRNTLSQRVNLFFATGFRRRVLAFDRLCVAAYGEIRGARAALGSPIEIADAMIAATAQAYGAQAIATRDVKDFAGCGLSVIDPWADPAS